MCEIYGTLCRFCKAGIKHDESPAKPRKGEFMRAHDHLALLVGEGEQEKFEKHYADHGVHVTHRKTASGDYEPVVTRPEHFDALLASRGLHSRR